MRIIKGLLFTLVLVLAALADVGFPWGPPPNP
jgi:hypothetical protein